MALAAALSILSLQGGVAAELLMFTRPGCPWCARFEKEIAPVYPLTAEGRLAPLRRIEVEAGGVDDAQLASPVIAVPTFVLVAEGREIGRITGYQNDGTFWGLFGKLLAGMSGGTHLTEQSTASDRQ